MKTAGPRRRTEEWLPSTATVVECRRTLETALREMVSPSEIGDELDSYFVRFEYEAIGKTHSGFYHSAIPMECGFTFELLFNSAHPERNTGFDVSPRRVIRITLHVVAVILALITVWLCIKLGISGDSP